MSFKIKKASLVEHFKNAMSELDSATKSASDSEFNRYADNCCNQSRKATEVLCKCIFLKSKIDSDKLDTNLALDLNASISTVSRKNNPHIKNIFQRERVFNRLNILRTMGNEGSHNNDSKFSEQDLAEVKSSLQYVCKWFFHEFIEEELPLEISKYFKTDVNGRFELTKIEDVLSPQFSIRERLVDVKKYKLKYEFWKVQILKQDMNILFVDKDINIKRTVASFFFNLTTNISMLTIITPHAEEDKRLDNIKRAIDEYQNTNGVKVKEFDVVSLSVFIWENYTSINNKIDEIYEEVYFMDQPLYTSNSATAKKLDLSINYIFKNCLDNEFANPVTLILGQGGIGKSSLTETLVNSINKSKHRKAILIKSEVLKDAIENSLGNITYEIDSIFDLYSLYVKYVGNDNLALRINNKEIFDMNIYSGNIVFIVDGLDEIGLLLKDKFNLSNFFNSLINLNNELGESRIIATSRDYYWENEKHSINTEFIDIRYLNGFDQTDVEKYLNNRFKKSPDKEKYIKKINTFLSTLENKYTEKFLPFYINLIAEMVESNGEFDTFNEFKVASREYYNNEEITDYLVYSILNREIVRHNYSIQVSDFIDIFIELISVYGDNVSAENIANILELYFDNENVLSKFKLNPLLNENGSLIKFRYDFLFDYFMTLYVIKSINDVQIDSEFIKNFSKLYNGKHVLFDALIKYYVANPSYQNKIKVVFEKLQSIFSNQTNEQKSQKIKKSISALMYLIQGIAGDSLSQDKRIGLITDLYDGNRIKNLFIWGEFYPINLVDIEVYKSELIHFDNLLNCTTNEKTKFLYSTISLSNEVINDKAIDKNIFDSSCITDKNITENFDIKEINEKQKEILIKNELKKVFKHFFSNGYFENRRKEGKNNFGRKLHMKQGLLDFLITEKIVQDCEKDKSRLSIDPLYQPIVNDFMKNNNDTKLRDCINKLMAISK